MSRCFSFLLLMACAVPQATADGTTYDCQFDWLVHGTVEEESDEWAIELVDIDHRIRIMIDEDNPSRARIVNDRDTVPAEVVERDGMVQIVEEAGEAVSATTTIFVLREVDGSHPAVHTSQHTHEPGFGASQIHGSCTPES